MISGNCNRDGVCRSSVSDRSTRSCNAKDSVEDANEECAHVFRIMYQRYIPSFSLVPDSFRSKTKTENMVKAARSTGRQVCAKRLPRNYTAILSLCINLENSDKFGCVKDRVLSVHLACHGRNWSKLPKLIWRNCHKNSWTIWKRIDFKVQTKIPTESCLAMNSCLICQESTFLRVVTKTFTMRERRSFHFFS